MTSGDRRTWDATAVLEALGGASSSLWAWEPRHDRLCLTGASRSLGLGPLAPEASSAAFCALCLPQDRHAAESLLQSRESGAAIAARIAMRGGPPCLWRGLWLEDGLRACGIVALESRFQSSERDGLTGLLDRRTFIGRARETLRGPGAYELVAADLNRLRRLNEALGHERADLVLAALGSRLRAAFSDGALTARIGEDEFAVLAAMGGQSAAETLRQALEQPLRVAGFDIHPTLSIGAVRAEGGEDAPEAAELLRRAELAVEASRTASPGGRSSAYGRSMETDGLSRLALESDLRGAIARGEICAFFQPIVRLATGELAGFEALARWRHPRRGFLGPDDFLPLMAEMGMMSELGEHMMRVAARQLGAWRRAHPAVDHLTCSVNLSTGEIDRDGLVDELADLVRENRLRPGSLKLEITESDIMRDPERAALTLHALRDAGAAIALDDFGTGFSSLSYLTRLPFDTLKIDRYFVRTMASNEGSAKIVRSVIQLGQDLAMEVVAEGVENGVMARALLELGCDYGQGYGYAPALSPQEAEVYLNECYADGAAPLRARG